MTAFRTVTTVATRRVAHLWRRTSAVKTSSSNARAPGSASPGRGTATVGSIHVCHVLTSQRYHVLTVSALRHAGLRGPVR